MSYYGGILIGIGWVLLIVNLIWVTNRTLNLMIIFVFVIGLIIHYLE